VLRMKPHFSLSQLTYLVGTAVVVGGLLVGFFYAWHKVIRSQRTRGDARSPTPRAKDSTAFTFAALQGVIADLREQQKEAQSLQRAASQRAEDNARLVETVLEEMNQGLIVFGQDGFISKANNLARELLGLDIWARRRFPEVLGTDSELARLVQACFDTGQVTRGARIKVRKLGGEVWPLAVSVIPLQGREGEVEGAICLVQPRREGPPDATKLPSN
jgi:PAS domain-containing protein